MAFHQQAKCHLSEQECHEERPGSNLRYQPSIAKYRDCSTHTAQPHPPRIVFGESPAYTTYFPVADTDRRNDSSSYQERHGGCLHRRAEAYAQPAVNCPDGCHQAARHDARDLPKQDMSACGRLRHFTFTKIWHDHNQQYSAYQQAHSDKPLDGKRNAYRAEQTEMVYHKTKQQLPQKRKDGCLQLAERTEQVNGHGNGKQGDDASSPSPPRHIGYLRRSGQYRNSIDNRHHRQQQRGYGE